MRIDFVAKVWADKQPWTSHMSEKNRTALLLLAKERKDWSLEVLPVRINQGAFSPCDIFVVSKK